MYLTTATLLTLLTPILAAPTSTIVLPAATSAAAAPGNAYVRNNCNFPIYVWSVASNVSDANTIASKAYYKEPLHYDPKTGISIKITTVQDGLSKSAPQLNFAYALDPPNSEVYYDLSEVFGDPFKGDAVKLTAANCPTIEWAGGVPPNPPAGTQACAQNVDLVLNLC